ncbi:hypothetical protein [Actinophytocola sp.]|uniref:hypothetical protein n=1 Tax=Actinophytocola sp. TaxID=1872138 RepID=UPI002D6DBC71|nr:hypothetical protein [Actinophytocola sp.]HYQ66137.1 hypothetical protein [Actinophytocola sp.]
MNTRDDTGRTPWRRYLRRGRRIVAWCATSTAAVLLVDLLLGLGYRTSTDSGVVVTAPASGTAHQALVVFPGYSMDGEVLSEAFAPSLGLDDAMVVARYAERGVSGAGLYRSIIGELTKLEPDTLRVYGASMGGMCAAEFLTHYSADGAPFGKAVLVLDTAPSNADDVNRPDWLLGLSTWYRGGPISSAAWALTSQLTSGDPAPEPDANPELIAEAKSRAAWAGTAALTSQGAFIRGFRMPTAAILRGVTDRVGYLHARDADNDPMIHVSRAIEGWRTVYPDLRVTTIPGRKGQWHIPLVERPSETMRAVLTV